MNKDNLADLLAKIALHDQQAFRDLYEQTASKLNSIAYRILHNPDSANEVLQEAFVQIWHNAREFRGDKAEPFTWMAAIVRYRCYDRVRSESRRLEGKLVADELNYEEHIAANEQSATK